MGKFDEQQAKFRTQAGFIAALDQSGGSTPKALKLYGIPESGWSSDARNDGSRARHADAHRHEPELQR